MGDIRLEVTGDGSKGQAALSDTAKEVKKLDESLVAFNQREAQAGAQRKQSEETWLKMGAAVAAAGAAVAAFAASATQKFMEAERVERQLARAAGDAAGALSEQAEALAQLNAVDDDAVKSAETLLVQWGGLGAASQATTQAILDYAAATGKDATEATRDLIRNVETGGAGLRKMGIDFEVTGDRATDLKNVVGALAEKFGGAGAAEAGSLHGSLTNLGTAFDDLMEDIGGAIAGFNEEFGIVSSLTEAIKGLRTAAFGDKSEDSRQERLQIEEQLTGRLEHRKELMAEIARAQSAGRADAVAEWQMALAQNEKAIGMLKQWRAEANAAIMGSAPDETGRTGKGERLDAAAEKEKALTLTKRYVQEETEAVRDGMAEQSVLIQQQNEEALAADREMYAEALKLQREASDAEAKAALDSWKQQAAMKKAEQEKMLKNEEEAEKKSIDEARQRTQQQEKQWAQAGEQIGTAFVNALSDQLQKLAAGEEFDAAVFVGDILASVISVAATVIGSAYGQPALGAAVGNLAAMGVRAGAGAISAGNKKRNAAKKYHSGGLITQHGGLEGDEVPMVGLEGEYVATREEVARAGGPSGMKQMLKGGPSVVVHVTALDALSAARSFVGDVGEGLKRAVRTGQGAVPALMGVSPR